MYSLILNQKQFTYLPCTRLTCVWQGTGGPGGWPDPPPPPGCDRHMPGDRQAPTRDFRGWPGDTGRAASWPHGQPHTLVTQGVISSHQNSTCSVSGRVKAPAPAPPRPGLGESWTLSWSENVTQYSIVKLITKHIIFHFSIQFISCCLLCLVWIFFIEQARAGKIYGLVKL